MKALFLLPYPLFASAYALAAPEMHALFVASSRESSPRPCKFTFLDNDASTVGGTALRDLTRVQSRARVSRVSSPPPADSYQSHRMDAASHPLCVSATTNFAILVMTDSGF